MIGKTNTFFFIGALVVVLFSMSAVSAADLKPIHVSGKYVREKDNERSKLEITQLPGGKVHVDGISLYGTSRESGPNIGELDFVSSLHNGCITYNEKIGKNYYKIKITLKDNVLIVMENGVVGNFGMNVSFAGEYHKEP